MRPHERRAAREQSQVANEEDPFGKITPPSFDTLEALEKAFPMSLPDSASGEYVLAQVQRQLGQQEVIQFLRQLINTSRGE